MKVKSRKGVADLTYFMKDEAQRLGFALVGVDDRNSLLGFSDRDPKNAASKRVPPPIWES